MIDVSMIGVSLLQRVLEWNQEIVEWEKRYPI